MDEQEVNVRAATPAYNYRSNGGTTLVLVNVIIKTHQPQSQASRSSVHWLFVFAIIQGLYMRRY